MNGTLHDGSSDPALIADITALARPLVTESDLQPLVDRARDARFIAIGEASHGTHEFYGWRAALSRRLIEQQRIDWIGVEGDWPDCWRIDRWVRGLDPDARDARELLASFGRWPTWMWANADVADFLDWLHEWNEQRPPSARVGFYGLDLYSLWDSLDRIIAWLRVHAPQALPDALKAWQCFVPFGGDPQRYAWSTRLVPESCENDVVGLLARVRRESTIDGDDAFDAEQNAEVVAGAERYYRAMVRADRMSWNVRDIHMADTIDRLAIRFGPESRALIWEHNTYVGDARATDMQRAGMVNVGELLRERHASQGVLLVGFAGHRGSVIAASAWGETEHVMPVPESRPGTHEHLPHRALTGPSLLLFPEDRQRPWLTTLLGHRAIGVVYDPSREHGNYVPTVMGARYDALIWFDETEALIPLNREPAAVGPEYETEPTGF